MQTIGTLFLMTVIAGCAGLETSAVEQHQGDPECTSYLCGNSPEVPYAGYHELNLAGESNAQGITIQTVGGRAAIRKGLMTYELTVDQSRLRGLDNGVLALTGQDLVGAEIVLLQHGTPLYAIYIEAVRQIAFPFQVGTLETYRFTWHEVGKLPVPDQHLCNGPMLFPPKKEGYEVFLGMEADETLVFEGDRIDADAKTMSQHPDPDWFNFGCAGRTLAKLHLSGQTCAARGPTCTDKAAWRLRQASLKMLVADYCGKGQAFTKPGTPLVWTGGPFYYAQSPADLEARWTEAGAACIGRPRLDAHPDPNAYPDGVLAAIAEACPGTAPPACANMDPLVMDGAELVSGNRPPIQAP